MWDGLMAASCGSLVLQRLTLTSPAGQRPPPQTPRLNLSPGPVRRFSWNQRRWRVRTRDQSHLETGLTPLFGPHDNANARGGARSARSGLWKDWKPSHTPPLTHTSSSSFRLMLTFDGTNLGGGSDTARIYGPEVWTGTCSSSTSGWGWGGGWGTELSAALLLFAATTGEYPSMHFIWDLTADELLL